MTSAILGYIFEFINDNKLWVLITIIITLVCNPIEMIWLSELFTNFTNAINKLEYNESIFTLWKMTAVYIFVDVANIISNYFDKIYYPKMEKFIRFKLIDVIIKNIEVNYDKEEVANHIVKTLKIPNTVTTFTSIFVYWVITFILTTIIIILYVFYVNPSIGLLTSGIFLIYFICYYYTLINTKIKSEAREHEENKLLSEIDDVLSNSISIITSQKIIDEKNFLISKHNNYDTVNEEHLWYDSKGGFILSVIGSLLLVIYVYILLLLYKKHKISSSDTIKLIITILFFVRYVKVVSLQSILVIAEYGKLTENETNIQNLITNINKTESNSSRNKTNINRIKKSDIPITGNIEFKNVTFGYPAVEGAPQKKNLDNVSFRIKPRDRVAFIGTNGSGKSTIIKLMCGFFEPTEGRILIDGVDMQEIDREYLRSKISVVSQKVVLFNRPVIDNICYATDIPKEKVVDILDHLKIADVFNKLPQGLNTMAGSRGENLSGGQRQIVYLLRSYLSNKPITLMDEPTASIDVFHKKYVLQMIHEMAKKTTLIIVTHDTEIASTFSKKIHIESGRITRVEDSGHRSYTNQSMDQMD